MLKKLALFAALIYSGVLIYASFIQTEYIPEVDVSFADKIFHFLAYFLLTLLWFVTCVYSFNFTKIKAILYASIGSVIFGIIIEVLQGMLTDYRALDVYDVIANTSGALIAVIIIVSKDNIGIKKI